MVEKIHPVSTYFKNIFKEGIDAILQCTYLSPGSVRIDTYILIDHPNQNLKLNFTLHIHISESAYYLFKDTYNTVSLQNKLVYLHNKFNLKVYTNLIIEFKKIMKNKLNSDRSY